VPFGIFLQQRRNYAKGSILVKGHNPLDYFFGPVVSIEKKPGNYTFRIGVYSYGLAFNGKSHIKKKRLYSNSNVPKLIAVIYLN
jgi:hypothetical protein